MKNLIILSVLFVSCHQIHEGKIIEKHVEPEHTYTYYIPMRCGKCTILLPHTGYMPTRYAIEVEGKSGSDTVIEKFYVDKNTWQCESCGDWFNDTIPCNRNDGY